MADLVIKQEELKQLDTILGEIPMRYGMPLLNFINGVVQKRQQEAQAQPAILPLAKYEGDSLDGAAGE